MEGGGDPRPSVFLGRPPSEGDMDLLEQLLSGDNAWLEVASRSPNSLAPPPSTAFFAADATAATVTTTTANTSWLLQTGGVSSSSVRERFSKALSYIRETQSDGDVLVQLWVPVKGHDGQLVLTTSDQPFTLDHRSDSLIRFREVSTKYHFSADVTSGTPGLPGRVFIGRLPEWSPDVRYFTRYEYPRVSHAQILDVHGTMGLPVFEKGSYSCLGVIELIMTKQKYNFTPELNAICSALQAVNMRSTEVSIIPRIKFCSASYKDALLEILEVLKAACLIHKLPLAQTWVTCAQQGKRGSRHSDENYRYCISTIDEACFVNEPQMQNFHEACSEHHLLRGQGVAGKAFTTNQPCFLPDIGSSTKVDYPLSHHAKIFNLKGAVAIRLRSTRTGTADFVLEFFLPTDCEALEEQKAVLDSLSATMRSVCQILRVVTDKEMENEAILEMNELNSFTPQGKNKVEELSFGGSTTDRRGETSSWTSLAETSQQDSELAALRMHGMLSPEGQGPSLAGVQTTAEGSKAKGRTKVEKTVSLQVLRQYFAGSLKDAARSLGVCPTTLKRICRQHGINRWPSRKIKKVDHSLKKLQQIIDSVHGAKTAFQLNTLYKDLTNTSMSSDNNLSGSITLPPTNQSNHTDKHVHHKSISTVPTTSQSHSSCGHNSDSSRSCSGGATKHAPQVVLGMMNSGNPVKDSPVQPLQIENTSLYEHFSVQEASINLPQHVTEKANDLQHFSQSPTSPKKNADASMRVKATFGAEKVRFRLKPECNFQELKHEIAKRLNIVDTNSLVLKYLDDDSEWVLMTCDADLQECFHVYKLADIQTIKISIHLAPNPATRVINGHNGLS